MSASSEAAGEPPEAKQPPPEEPQPEESGGGVAPAAEAACCKQVTSPTQQAADTAAAPKPAKRSHPRHASKQQVLQQQEVAKAAPIVSADYLGQLIKDKQQLSSFPLPLVHVQRLVDDEISKVRQSLFQLPSGSEWASSRSEPLELPAPEGEPIQLQEKIYVPVGEHPEYNFVGRLLGPRGMTAKQLEQETGCKIMIRGRGSMRDKKKEEQNRGKANWEHLYDELHVLISVEDTHNRAHLKLRRALEEVRQLLVPIVDGEDELKKRQLMELAIINGTYRDCNYNEALTKILKDAVYRQQAAAAAVVDQSQAHQPVPVRGYHYPPAAPPMNGVAPPVATGDAAQHRHPATGHLLSPARMSTGAPSVSQSAAGPAPPAPQPPPPPPPPPPPGPTLMPPNAADPTGALMYHAQQYHDFHHYAAMAAAAAAAAAAANQPLLNPAEFAAHQHYQQQVDQQHSEHLHQQHQQHHHHHQQQQAAAAAAAAALAFHHHHHHQQQQQQQQHQQHHHHHLQQQHHHQPLQDAAKLSLPAPAPPPGDNVAKTSATSIVPHTIGVGKYNFNSLHTRTSRQHPYKRTTIADNNAQGHS